MWIYYCCFFTFSWYLLFFCWKGIRSALELFWYGAQRRIHHTCLVAAARKAPTNRASYCRRLCAGGSQLALVVSLTICCICKRCCCWKCSVSSPLTGNDNTESSKSATATATAQPAAATVAAPALTPATFSMVCWNYGIQSETEFPDECIGYRGVCVASP